MNKKIKYDECFIAFLDILGVKNLVKDFDTKPELLQDIIKVLKLNRAFTDANGKETSNGILDIRSWFFSDSFVFLMEAEPINLSHLFLVIRYLQDKLWENGYCLRGAVTKGKMYYPKKYENILLGQGMIDVYKLESEIAIYPRIVVDEELYKYIDIQNVDAYPFGESGKLKEFIKKDYDGIFFVDLLNEKILRMQEEKNKKSNNNRFSIRWDPNNQSNFKKIKDSVEKTIKTNIENSDTKIKQKYEWLNSYLNKAKNNE